MTKVINIFGAPGSGKSTLMGGLFYRLKMAGINVEMSHEYIKEKLYEGTPYPFHDQLYTYAKQNKKLNQLNGKVDFIVTDSPSVQCIAYDEKEPPIYRQMALDYFNQYDNLNFYIERTHEYQPSGRNQTEEQAKMVGDRIKNMLDDLKIEYTILPANIALERILDIIGVKDGERNREKVLMES